LNQPHSGFLPATAWLGRLSLAVKIALVSILGSFPLIALIYSAATAQPLSASVILILGSLVLFSWYLLASLCLAFTHLFRELHEAHIRLENGDFDVRMVPMGDDEGTQLAGQFNDTAREVGRIVACIRNAATEVAHATIELKANATLVADAVSQQEQSTSHMAATIEELSASIAEMATQSRDAEQTAHSVSDLSTEGRRAIAQSSEEVQSLAQAVNEASQLMDHLTKRSAEVGQSTGMIREISDQTNLLALNAAIEAARAGEQGRGFAVVADEVRKLSQRARTSADEITRTVDTIQAEIRQAVVHMASAGGQAQESAAHARGATAVLDKIDKQAAAALDSVHQIAAGTQQQSVASSDISRHVEQIAASTQQNSCAANETAGMVSHLTSLASGMICAVAGAKK
jgi:methyl-accepting chemotaxis protein